jgi:hypothetical protein
MKMLRIFLIIIHLSLFLSGIKTGNRPVRIWRRLSRPPTARTKRGTGRFRDVRFVADKLGLFYFFRAVLSIITAKEPTKSTGCFRVL